MTWDTARPVIRALQGFSEKKARRMKAAGPQAWEEEGYCPDPFTAPPASPYEQPVVEPQVSHFKQVPLRTRVKLAQFGHGSPS